jgi:hypothetical protein
VEGNIRDFKGSDQTKIALVLSDPLSVESPPFRARDDAK